MTTALDLVAATALGAVLCTAVPLAAGAESASAEYAIRWNARDGGPASGNETMAILKTRATRPRQFNVDYYDLPSTMTAPPGFSMILRRRVEDGRRTELTWKLRGDHAAADWACPLRNPRQSKAEIDVAFGGADAVTRAYSYSCMSDDADLAASELSATIRPCTAAVTRRDAGSLKIEEWRLPGNVLIIDVSLGGKDTPGALDQFRTRIAEPLLAAGIVPLADSKSELGSRCR